MTVAIITKPPETPDLFGTAPSDLVPDERRDSTPVEARERADRLRAGIVQYSQMRQDIADAFAGRDWIALGYGSWYEYVDGEFGEQLARLDRSERREAIQDLRGQGMSVRQIASTTGLPKSTVSDAVQQVSGSGHLKQPEKVTGSDGKSYASTRPAPKPTETPGPVEPLSTASTGPGPSPAPAAAAPGPSQEPAAADPVASVAAALDQHVPDPEAPKRAWRKSLYGRHKAVTEFAGWLRLDDFARYATDDDVETLRQLAAQFTDMHRRVVDARSKVTTLRRMK